MITATQEIQSIEVFLDALLLLKVLPGRTGYIISRSEGIPFPLNLSQMSSDTEDWFGHVCHMQRDNISRQAYKQDIKEQLKRSRKTTEEVE